MGVPPKIGRLPFYGGELTGMMLFNGYVCKLPILNVGLPLVQNFSCVQK